MAVPYTFASSTAPIPLNELDVNFSTPITLGSTSVYLGNTTTTISGLTLNTATLNSPTIAGGSFVIDNLDVGTSLTGCNGVGSNGNNFAAGTDIGNNISGNYITAVGQGALASMTTSTDATAVGFNSQGYVTSGNYNTSIGSNSILYNVTGGFNTAVGAYSQVGVLTYNQSYNASVGAYSLWKPQNGAYNSVLGAYSGYAITNGSYNVAVGYKALFGTTTGSGNTMINPNNSSGTYVPVFNPTTESNRLILGSTAVTNAYVQVAWTVVSDARDKTNFAPVPHGLDFVSKLEPTSYQFTESRENPIPVGVVRYGFKAQDIMALEGDNPIIVDAEDPEKLKFNSDSLIPVLVNAIKELKAELDLLKLKVGA